MSQRVHPLWVSQWEVIKPSRKIIASGIISHLIGIVASKNVDYVSKNTSVPIPFSDQDVFQVCEPIQTNTDLVVERTEYFTVQLQGPKGVLMASCQVAIIDTDGGKRFWFITCTTHTKFTVTTGPSECYQSAVTRGGLPVLGWVLNDPA